MARVELKAIQLWDHLHHMVITIETCQACLVCPWGHQWMIDLGNIRQEEEDTSLGDAFLRETLLAVEAWGNCRQWARLNQYLIPVEVTINPAIMARDHHPDHVDLTWEGSTHCREFPCVMRRLVTPQLLSKGTDRGTGPTLQCLPRRLMECRGSIHLQADT
jgi:hypothetical protein